MMQDFDVAEEATVFLGSGRAALSGGQLIFGEPEIPMPTFGDAVLYVMELSLEERLNGFRVETKSGKFFTTEEISEIAEIIALQKTS
ncbi:hypothetical protein [Methylocystis sp. JR02]|uniref:hypothetical protein n=1 Tax=Methylocystis sp. JR02 TaxID=3046284 RepID=UPI0024B90170|nr:hypothetical protein [Methylocystis sp. JR02]MDJ0447916.1 hypothetical protein [Methylocystis sp. JR02]